MNFFWYPRPIIAGYATMPMVAAVAAPEPLIAAKNAQARIVAMASPPGRCRTQTFMTSKRSSPTLPSSKIAAHQHEERNRDDDKAVERREHGGGDDFHRQVE